MNHKHPQNHKTHHNSDFGETITFPLFFMVCHGGYTQISFFWDFQVGNFEIPKIKTPATLDTHNFLWRLPIEAMSKQSCSPHQKLSNDMWHASRTHVTQGDSQFLVVRNQINILIPNVFFSHNLCHTYSNG
jgi:hypothetical protein